LKGPNFNGNNFALAALETGASFAIVDEPIANSESFENRILQVDDVLTTLQSLAKHHISQFSIPFIGITGSNGKTTTKELVYAVLSSHYKTYTTQGNLNNHIGVPLTLLSIGSDAEMAVIEMGANHLNEIASYCEYAMPNFGLITNCGKAHLEGFGSEDGVKKGKGELFDSLRLHKGTAFVMSDYDYLVNYDHISCHLGVWGGKNVPTHKSKLKKPMKIKGWEKISGYTYKGYCMVNPIHNAGETKYMADILDLNESHKPKWGEINLLTPAHKWMVPNEDKFQKYTICTGRNVQETGIHLWSHPSPLTPQLHHHPLPPSGRTVES
jgi:hypothetical protein